MLAILKCGGIFLGMKLTSEQLKCGHVEMNGATSIKWNERGFGDQRNRYHVGGSFEGYHNLGYHKTLSAARKVALEFNKA
jgi:hypothetical protein